MQDGLPDPIYHTLPEFTRYEDDGCEISPSCLSCPLPKCKYDDPGWVTRARKAARAAKIRSLYAQGLSQKEVARRVGVSKRTVLRTLNGREQDTHPQESDNASANDAA